MQVPKEPRHWYVLISFDPKDAEEQLRREAIRRADAGQEVFQSFVPAQFLMRRVSSGLQHDEPLFQQQPSSTEALSDDGFRPIEDPWNPTSVRQNNEIRAALWRYVFIFGRVSEIDTFLSEDWNKLHYNRIRFFLDRQGEKVYVRQKVMKEFIQMLADKRLSFELAPAVGDLRQGEPVRFRNNAFEGRTVYVVESRRTQKGHVLTVEMDLIGNVLRMKVYNVRDEDIIRMDDDLTKYARTNDLIKRNQQQLLAILARRINRKETEDSRMHDVLKLDTIYAMRFRHFDVDETAAHRRYLAQILICACLRHDADGRAEYTALVLAELAEINQQSESKAATDVRARMHAALFLATGEPEYRTLARNYVREHQPKSEPLRTLIRLISKRPALKNI